MFLLKYFAVGKDEHRHNEDEDDAVSLVGAQETLDALSSVLGIMPPPPLAAVATTTPKQQPGGEGWSTQLADAKKKELLAEPAVECPPYSDPSSVLILDQGSLEFELEPSSSSLTTTNAADAAATATADVSADSSNCSLLLSSSSDVTDYDDETSTTEASTATSTKSTTTIRFASMVSVAEIPSHRDMDSEDVERIWTSTREVNQNGRRNVTEWNWDQRDWKNATEEDQMIYDATTNEYIHPATWEEIEADRLQEQQEMERMNRALAAAQAEAEAEATHQNHYQQPHEMATPQEQEQEQELDRMHLALAEAVRRERIRKEANRILQQNYQRSRHHHRTSSSSSSTTTTTTSSSSRASTSPRSRANLARKRMMRSPQVHGVKHPYYSMAGTVGGGSLTRFADT